MFQKNLEVQSAQPCAAVPDLLRQISPRLAIVFNAIGCLKSRPWLGQNHNGRGEPYRLLKCCPSPHQQIYFYLGRPSLFEIQLLSSYIQTHWPQDESCFQIRERTGVRKRLRQKIAELAISLGYRIRGHNMYRRR